jgi:glycerophosphoryl diester phosphodiesterase
VTNQDRPLVIAHRGASADAPENTLQAYRLAASQGADWVELDVRRTADDRLAVLHDAALPDGRTLVDCAWSELPDTVPSLAAALDACAGMGVNIEIKNAPVDPDYDPGDTVADAVVGLLDERSGRDEVLISSFTPHTVNRVRAVAPGLATAWLVMQGTSATVETAVAEGHRALHPWDHGTTADVVERARREHLEVNVWTVDDPERMRALTAMGVTGIVTNVPERAREVLDG